MTEELDNGGVVRVPAFDLPPSAALSEIARAGQSLRRPAAGPVIPRLSEFSSEESFREAVLAFRNQLDTGLARPLSETVHAAYPVRIEQATLGGVPVEIFTPAGEFAQDQILINLHGGAFCAGAKYIARVESIPVCHLGGWKVVSVDYRQGFEHKFPAASEDVAAVYSELLKTYPARRIGIFGGSAGGAIASQAVAWLIEHGQPVPGALGIFGAGTGGAGDSAYFSAISSAQTPPFDLFADLLGGKVGYFSDVRADDYLVNPNIAPEAFRAQYPPTLLITGTRASDLSPAIAAHRALAGAGVDASLHVFDGLGHCFYYNISLPEAQDAYATIVRFYREKLSR
ncbi:alpha/beta hydrolase [Phenylobacterium sp. LjRoot219]|uniref:alpha/beta hydrolase n=1 Tax=Phenylobacterium sp. LjRoot219 TaxID=3342283 RepID=UPI003ECEFFC4